MNDPRYEQLEKLHQLKEKGALNEAEFQAEKAKLLGVATGSPPVPAAVATASAPATTLGTSEYWGMPRPTFLMLLHLSQLASFVVPLGGVVLAVVMWITHKDKDAEVDAHGRIVLNWLVSFFIYAIVIVPLCFVLIGIPLLMALVICSIVFAILGGVRANDGIRWTYPLSIPFFGKPAPPVA